MRLLPYFILAYIMLGLQVGIGAFVSIHGAAPNLALLAVIFIALNAPRDAALLGGFGIGFVQDLLTAQQPGLYAFSYGLVAMLVVALQQAVSRNHVLAHFVLALVGGLITTFVLLIHGLFHHGGVSARVEFTRMLYTAILAPFVLFVLGRIRGAFAFQPGRKRKY
jgi:rod shape-determining protein MreD